MTYKLVIFDFDGTLADSFPWFLRVFNEVADRFGFRRLEEGEVDCVRGYSSRQILRHFGVPLWKVPAIAAHMRTLAAQDGDIALFEGVDRLLSELSGRGVALAVVTSNTEENVRRVLGPENAALISHFACGASLFGKGAKFRTVLRRSGVAPRDAICIGDELRDGEAARAAGLAFGAVTWGYALPDVLAAQDPDRMFSSFDEIIQAVAGSGSRLG